MAQAPSIVATVGIDVPAELVRAAGLEPVRIIADVRDWTRAAAHPSLASQTPRTQALIAELMAAQAGGALAGVALSHGCVEDAQLFSVLRELDRLGRGVSAPVAFLDAQYGDDVPTLAYNRARLAQFIAWLERVNGKPVERGALSVEIVRANVQRRSLRQLLAQRAGPQPKMSGVEALDLIATLGSVPIAEGERLISQAAERYASASPLDGRRVLVTGAPQETSALYALIEASGCIVVGEDHLWGGPIAERDLDEAGDPFESLLARWRKPPSGSPRQSSRERAERLVEQAESLGVDAVIHLRMIGEESAPWDVHELARALEPLGVPLLRLKVGAAPDAEAAEQLAADLADFWNGKREDAPQPASGAHAATPKAPRPEAQGDGRRSRKTLASTSDFGAWQRDWFADVRARAEGGPFAVVNADAPQEILRAMDVPYVVNQWWASIVAAKQHGRRHNALLRAADYPADVEGYSAQGLAAALDPDPASGAWGGLPKPDILSLTAASDAGTKLFEAWARETDATLLSFPRTIDSRWDIPTDWWNDLPERWEQTLEPERLDLMTAQLSESIARLEAVTGRKFQMARFLEVMNLVNEQEDYYRRTRDLIAATTPAPAGIADTMPATMVPQWHRGTTWGRDAAKRFYEEVAARAAAGEAACPGERVRLMWVGRGLWSDMGFYQRWEESHGAVFVWSMYLGLAADGYLRTFEGERDALRALAARFVTMGDELRMPTWAGAWHVKEARTHGVHGAVAIDDADPFVLEALERAGVPVLRLPMGNMSVDGETLENRVTAFIEGPVEARRREG